MKFKKIWYEILICIYILSFNFQNLNLFSQIGSIAKIGIYYLLPVTICLYILQIKKIRNNRISKIYTNYIYYLLVINLITNGIFYIFFNKIEIFDKLFYVKSIQLVLHFLFQLITIQVLYFLFEKICLKKLRVIFNVNFIFLFIYFLYQKYILFLEKRIPLFTPEPSIAGYLMSIYIFIILYLNKKASIKTIFFIIYLIMIYYINSKGAIVVLLLSFLFCLSDKLKKKKITTVLLGILSLITFKLFYYKNLINAIQNDIEKYTSLVTRTWSIISAIISFMVIPIGSGGVYLLIYQLVGEKIKNLFMIFFPKLHYSEIESLLKTGVNLTPKSGFYFGILIAGIGYIYFELKLFQYFLKKIKKIFFLKMVLIVYFLSNLIYISEIQTPLQILIFSFLLYVIDDKNKCINLK